MTIWLFFLLIVLCDLSTRFNQQELLMTLNNGFDSKTIKYMKHDVIASLGLYMLIIKYVALQTFLLIPKKWGKCNNAT
ncbi:hypothetical protein EUGRSUZ_E02930 [Eucalyptus grandis]|uniref:Uncharacterized protein n=2 Tax=Eucalyptus grandis TaxID=71139 RepID=A0ACC3KXI6_EUCGR|nr:hypothetical protein EUGRSUZ_E02930 [Eucalyptus grandis]